MIDQKIFTPSATPYIVYLDPYTSTTSLGVTPNGSTYTVEYTITPTTKGLTPNWYAIDNMTAATTAQTKEFGKISALRFTVTGGTNIEADINN